MTERVLDRLVQFDEASKAYPIRALVGAKAARSYSWRTVTTDQGRQGACVGHGVVQEATARPVTVFGDPVKQPPDVANLNNIARDVYYEAQKIDPWPGGEYAGASPTYAGTSVLAGVKIGQQRGWWTEYRWALGPGPDAAAQDVILALGYAGPVIMGTAWRSGMWRPDADGYLRATGSNQGGHCYLLSRYSKRRDAVFTTNSWGGAGAGWITRPDLVSLLADDGEAVVVQGRKK
jgi:hypothetical protein